jgi:hypothetical protein
MTSARYAARKAFQAQEMAIFDALSSRLAHRHC